MVGEGAELTIENVSVTDSQLCLQSWLIKLDKNSRIADLSLSLPDLN